jgi:hypothetical protein
MEAYGWIAQPLQSASLTVKERLRMLFYFASVLLAKKICTAMALAPVALSGDSKTLSREGEK